MSSDKNNSPSDSDNESLSDIKHKMESANKTTKPSACSSLSLQDNDYSENAQVFTVDDSDNVSNSVVSDKQELSVNDELNINENIVRPEVGTNIDTANCNLMIGNQGNIEEMLKILVANSYMLNSKIDQTKLELNQEISKSREENIVQLTQLKLEMSNQLEANKLELNAKIQEVKNECTRFRTELEAKIESEKTNVNKDVNELHMKTNTLDNKIDQKVNDCMEYTKSVAMTCTSQSSEVKDEIKNVSLNISKLNAKVDKVSNELVEHVKESVTKQERESKRIDNLYSRIDLTVKQCESKNNNISHTIQEHSKNIQQLDKNIHEQETHIASIQDRLVDEITKQVALHTKSAEANTFTTNVMTNRSNVNLECILVDFNNDEHPMYFLKFVKKYVELNNDPWDIQLLTIVKHFKGQAKNWILQKLDAWSNYEQFETAFKRKFWGILPQKQFENKLMGSGEFVPGKTNLVNYVLEYFNKTQYLDNKMDIATFLSFISKHLPTNIAASIATAKQIQDVDDLENLLMSLSSLGSSNNYPKIDKYRESKPNELLKQYSNDRSYQNPNRSFDTNKPDHNRYRSHEYSERSGFRSNDHDNKNSGYKVRYINAKEGNSQNKVDVEESEDNSARANQNDSKRETREQFNTQDQYNRDHRNGRNKFYYNDSNRQRYERSD